GPGTGGRPEGARGAQRAKRHASVGGVRLVPATSAADASGTHREGSRRVMDLVDLNGRQDEPAVRAVLELSHGSVGALEEARTHYRTRDWLFLGWQEGADFVACAGAERLGTGTMGIRSIAVDP